MEKLNKKICGICIAVVLFLIAMVLIFTKVQSKLSVSGMNDFEYRRSTEYHIVTEDDIKIDDCENVTFSAFFTRDLDGDGYAERLNGTCKSLESSDVLYMDINVFSEGRLENARITLNAQNFTWTTSLVKDNIIDNDYIGETKTVSFKTLQSGTQKLLWGTVKPDIKNNKNNYSRVNSVTLTGDYYDNANNKTTISKTVEFYTDWYGTTSTTVNRYYSEWYSYQKREMDKLSVDGKTVVNFKAVVAETKEQLLLQKQMVELTIPDFNGYSPLSVKVKDNNIRYEYDESTRKLTIVREATVSPMGTILSSISRSNIYNVEVTYPLDAYEAISSDIISLQIPIKGYNYGFNNDSVNVNNPDISSSEETITLKYTREEGEVWNVKPFIGTYSYNPTSHTGKYIISKTFPSNIYRGDAIQNEGEDTYPVYWRIDVGRSDVIQTITLEEKSSTDTICTDKFVGASSISSTEPIIKTVQISFSNVPEVLGQNGWIELYDADNGELIKRFTKTDWRTPYTTEINSLKIVTSTPIGNGSMYIYQTKKINDDLLTNVLSKEEFDNISAICTYVKGSLIPREGYEISNDGIIYDYKAASYEENVSLQSLSIDNKDITNQETSNINLNINTTGNDYGQSYWKNGEFLVELPQEIINANIKSVNTSITGVKIKNASIYQENNKYYIRISTENEKEIKSFSINLGLTITPNPTLATALNRTIKLYAYNDICNNYYSKTNDIYDIDNDGNTSENIGYSSVYLNIIAPSGLITSEYVSEYNGTDEITIAPNVANIDIADSNSSKTATVNVTLSNNYIGAISEIEILGNIPFTGNKKIITDENMNSEFDTELTGPINIPSSMANYVTVYYSTKEKPTKDLNDYSNNWVSKNQISDWSTVKSYLVKLNGYILRKDETQVVSYEIRLPDDVANNAVSFSNHAVYYCLETDNGKLETSTEPNKVGVSAVETFNLEMNKIKFNYPDVLIPGATYSVSTTDYEGNTISRLGTTDENGYLKFEKLYLDREYSLKEIASPMGYALSESEIRFLATKDENSNFIFRVLEGRIENEIVPTEDSDGRSLVILDIADESEFKLVINKKSTSGENIENVKFLVSGKNANKFIKTDSEGIAVLEGLSPNYEYQVREIEANGYYMDSEPISFRIVRDELDNLVIQSSNDIFESSSIVDGGKEETTIVSFDLINKPIEKFNLKIVKIEENSNEDDLANLNKLKDAKYNFESIDAGSIDEYITDENGEININDLYLYVPGKSINGWYTISEIEAPAGYCTNGEEVSVRVSKDNEDNFDVNILNRGDLESVKGVITDKESNTITIILQDKPLFKLTKIDSETGEPLANTEFIIIEVDNKGIPIDYAKDLNGEYVGTLNEKGDYIVTTDENGIIILPLRNGLYEITEVGYPEGYLERSNSEIFKINGGNQETTEDEFTAYDYSKVTEINNIEDLVNLSLYINSENNLLEKNNPEDVKLMRTLDFNEDSSYEDSTRTDYGDLNGDGIVESIKQELTTQKGFTAIGNKNMTNFSGKFDGQNYEIRNLYIDSDDYYVGLFGNTKDAVISNLGVTGNIKVDKSAGVYVGGVAAKGSNIENCYSKVDIDVRTTSGGASINVGGIIGCVEYDYYNDKTINISNCYNEGRIVAHCEGENSITRAGGIIGNGNYRVNINDCYNKGNINGVSDCCYSNTGGIMGDSGKAYNCYNTGDISCESIFIGVYCGGISGDSSYIYNCYNTGKIYGYINKDNLKPSSNVGSFRYKDIYSDYYTNYIYLGGITGSSGAVYNSYNTGDVIARDCTELNIEDYEEWNNKIWRTESNVGGISGNSYAENVYNKGNINIITKNDHPNTVYTHIGGISGNGNAKNGYNLGNVEIEAVNYGGDLYEQIGTVVSNYDDSENCYYLNNLDISGDNIIYSGESKTQNEMKTSDFVELLGTENWHIDSNENDGYPILKEYEIENNDSQTIVISKIEDLIDIAVNVNSGNNLYKNTTILLNNDLDFNDPNSYEDSQTTEYGDINENNEIEPLITELTTEKGFLPIGVKDTSYGFFGIFDGQNYEIKNLYINNRSSAYVGLFGYIKEATVKNLNVSGNINSGYNIGGIVGRSYNYSTISNCHSNVQITSNTNYACIGGIVGYIEYDNTITNCSSNGNINSTSNRAYIGGIIGYIYGSSIVNNCNSNINIESKPDIKSYYIGGIAGYNSSSTRFENCYNTGNFDIENSDYLGGICGVSNSSSSKFINCYNVGCFKCENVSYVGGILGKFNYGDGKIITCYNVGNIISEADSNQYEGYLIGKESKYIYNSYYLDSITLAGTNQNEQGISKSDEEMKNQEIVRLLGVSDWKFDDNNSNNGYPILLTDVEKSEMNSEKITEISTIEDLLDFSISIQMRADYSNTEVVLINDLDFNDDNSYENPNRTDYGDINENGIIESLKVELTTGKGFNTIGGNSNIAFTGIFNGNNKKISNMHINRDNMYIGLFKNIQNAEIKDLGVDGEITGAVYLSTYIGGLVGYAENSVINNCYNECSIKGFRYLGGLVGYADSYTKINDCYNNGEITFESLENTSNYVYIGGISGICQGKIENCYNSGILTFNGSESNAYIAGITGSGNDLKNCYNIANINVNNLEDDYVYVGGIVADISNNYIDDTYYYVDGANIDSCYNTGNIIGNENVSAGGIIGNLYMGYSTGDTVDQYFIINCYNTGEITAGGYIGGIIALSSSYGLSYDSISIKECYNTGNISNGQYSGGIAGSYTGKVYKCYNIGTITSIENAGGIVGSINSTCIINNTYNTGIVNSSNTAGGIVGYLDSNNSLSIIKNSYNAGLITANGTAGNIVVEIDDGNQYYTNGSSLDESTLYYLNNNISAPEINTLGTVVTDEQLKSEALYNDLNSDGVWVYKKVDYPKFSGLINSNIDDVLELTIENTIKKYNVTTKVDGNIGGIISGQDEDVYEVINYNQSNQKAIEMIPDDGYIITKITVNGSNMNFEANDDGSYIIPAEYFTNVQEDKNIVVSFAASERTLTVNKVDQDNESIKLSGAKFNVVSNIMDNIPIVDNQEGDVARNIIDSMQSNGTYYFTKSNNTYIPNNKGYHNTTANSYIKIDLSGKRGIYKVIVNASISSESGYDFGYATITTTTSAPSYSSSTGQFMKISGSGSAKNYTSQDLTGGNIYYLHLGYRKDGSANSGSDQVVINSVILQPENVKVLGFENEEGKLVSNNQNENGSLANTYCLVDLTNIVGKVKLRVNAEISSEEDDYGYVIVTDSDSEPLFNQEDGRFVFISGEVAANNYEYTLNGGQMYYIHFGYYKDGSNAGGTDTFTINNVELDYGDVITDDKGKAQIELPTGSYTVREIEAPEGYTLNNTPQSLEVSYTNTNELTFTNKKQTTLNVHHYLKNGNGEYTQIKVADDEVYKGDIGSEYTTSPRMDLEGLQLEKDESNNYKLPENATSTYGEEEINVNYYYEASKVKLTIHHYLLGTENALKEDDEIEVNGNVIFADDGTYTVSTEAEYDLDSNEKYAELLNDYILMNVISLNQGILNIEDQYTYNSNSEIIYYYDVDSIGVTEQKVWKNLENETAKNYRSTFKAYENIETASTQNEIIEVNGKQYALLENVAEQVVVGNGSVNLNLPKYAGQTEREYILVETKAEKYDSSNDVWIELTENEQYRKSENDLVTTNELLTKVTKEVVWKDTTDEIASNYRATLKLYRKAENSEELIELDNQIITGDGQVEFDSLPLYENNKEIEYYIFESNVEQKDGESWITLTEDKDYVVTDSGAKVENTLKRTFKIKKQWNLTDYENYRATFNLNKTVGENTQLVESKVIRGNGTATFENLNVYDNGTEITYSVDEVKIEKTLNDGETWTDIDISGFRVSHEQTEGFDDLITNAISGEFGLNINKTEDKTGNALSGAKFNISIKDEDDIELVDLSKDYITGEDGSLINAISELAITGVGKTYTVTITEDGNVEGYKALAGPIEFTVNTRVNTQDNSNELVTETKDVDNTKGVTITENLITVNIENEWDTGYKVKYYYDDVLEDTDEFDAKYGSSINNYEAKPKYDMVIDKVTTSDNSGNVGELPLIVGADKDKNIINVYYKSVFTIEAEVTEHSETSIDGTSQTVNGGAIYEDENTLYQTEEIKSGDDSSKYIIIKPDDGYEIIKVTITDNNETQDLDVGSFVRDDGKIILSKDNGFFENVTSNKKIDVEFRKSSKVTIKYLEKGTNTELATEDTIKGYDGKVFTTQRNVITGYRSAEVNISETETSSETYGDMTKYDENAENKMKAYDITVIYWYEEVPKGTIIVRYIEIDDEDIRNGLTLNSGREIVINDSTIIKAFGLDDIADEDGENSKEQYEDYVGTEINTVRKQFVDNVTGRAYKSVDGPISNNSNIVVVGKDVNQYDTTIEENDLDQNGEIDVVEIRYYYERDYVITTAIKPHEENGVEVKGGNISGEGTEYEIINRKGSNKKVIEVTPDENYHIKSLVINDQEIDYTNMEDENGNVKFDLNYFNNIIENKNVVVIYEKNLSNIIIKYINSETGEEIATQTIKKCQIGQNYEVQAKDIDGYTRIESRDPLNAKGIVGLEDIEVIYYYSKNNTTENENNEPENTPSEPENTNEENTEPDNNQTDIEIIENGSGTSDDTETKEAKVEITYNEVKENQLAKVPQKTSTKNVKTYDNIMIYVIAFITSSLIIIFINIKNKNT